MIGTVLELRPGEDWRQRTEKELAAACRAGAVLNAGERCFPELPWVQQELELAAAIARQQDHRGHILPIHLEGAVGPPLVFADRQAFDFSAGSFDERMDTLVEELRKYDWSPEP